MPLLFFRLFFSLPLEVGSLKSSYRVWGSIVSSPAVGPAEAERQPKYEINH